MIYIYITGLAASNISESEHLKYQEIWVYITVISIGLFVSSVYFLLNSIVFVQLWYIYPFLSCSVLECACIEMKYKNFQDWSNVFLCYKYCAMEVWNCYISSAIQEWNIFLSWTFNFCCVIWVVRSDYVIHGSISVFFVKAVIHPALHSRVSLKNISQNRLTQRQYGSFESCWYLDYISTNSHTSWQYQSRAL